MHEEKGGDWDGFRVIEVDTWSSLRSMLGKTVKNMEECERIDLNERIQNRDYRLQITEYRIQNTGLKYASTPGDWELQVIPFCVLRIISRSESLSNQHTRKAGFGYLYGVEQVSFLHAKCQDLSDLPLTR